MNTVGGLAVIFQMNGSFSVLFAELFWNNISEFDPFPCQAITQEWPECPTFGEAFFSLSVDVSLEILKLLPPPRFLPLRHHEETKFNLKARNIKF